jgi:hypothetical protein
LVREAMREGIYLPNRSSNLCSYRHCSFAAACEFEFGGRVKGGRRTRLAQIMTSRGVGYLGLRTNSSLSFKRNGFSRRASMTRKSAVSEYLSQIDPQERQGERESEAPRTHTQAALRGCA